MRGDQTIKILEILTKSAASAIDIIDAILSSEYGASLAKLNYELSRRERHRNNREVEKQKIQNYYGTLYKLKKENLIQQEAENGKTALKLTPKGKNKLVLLKKLREKILPKNHYLKEISDRFTIIVFDIPETEKKKRNWLRETLKNLNFKMIQKSVWIGKIKIPKEFLNDIYKLKLEDFVEIFEISKTGSLKQIT